MLADVQKSPARNGENPKFDRQTPEPRASLFFPTTSPRTSDGELLVCWPTSSNTELESRIPNRDAALGRARCRRREVGAFSGKACSVG